MAQTTFPSANAFLGAVTTLAFDRVELRAISGDTFETDNLAVGANQIVRATPEPEARALLAAGLAALVVSSRVRGAGSHQQS